MRKAASTKGSRYGVLKMLSSYSTRDGEVDKVDEVVVYVVAIGVVVVVKCRYRLGIIRIYTLRRPKKNIMTSMRYKSKDLTKVRGANMAGGANRNLSEQGAEHHQVKEGKYYAQS